VFSCSEDLDDGCSELDQRTSAAQERLASEDVVPDIKKLNHDYGIDDR
jgi:hypothetical protein